MLNKGLGELDPDNIANDEIRRLANDPEFQQRQEYTPRAYSGPLVSHSS